MPGAIATIVENGRVAGIHPFGVRRAGEAAAVDSETIFEAASLSKPVFASAVLRLVAAKALDLDRPLDQVLPLASDPRARLISARHLLSHSSGAPHGYRGQPTGQFKTTAGRQMAEIALEWNKPVESWFYENVERAMPRLNRPALPNYMQPNAASSLMTTAADYARFLLHSFSLDAMRQPQARVNSDLSWGLGCGLEMASGRQWFWHWGDNPGFKNFFIADAKARSGILIFTNGDGGAKLYQRIVRHALGRDFSTFLWA